METLQGPYPWADLKGSVVSGLDKTSGLFFPVFGVT